MKKKITKHIFTICLAITLLISSNTTVLASGHIGYTDSDIDSCVGEIIIDPDYTYQKNGKDNYQPYQERYFDGSGQCVGYAWARLEEKLNLTKIFSSGNYAKNIPSYAPDGEARESTSGEKYTIKVYTSAEDIEANMTANTLVCFKRTNNANHAGHVVYVEAVLEEGSTKYVYYTEGGGSYYTKGTSGTLKKKEMSKFLKSYNSGKCACTGIVVFEPDAEAASMGNITLDKSSLKLQNNVCQKLVATTPGNQNVAWTSSNPSVATVSDGVISPITPGNTTITATLSYYGKIYEATCNVTVTDSSKTQISFKSISEPGTIKKGKDVPIKGTVKATNGKIKCINAVILDSDGKGCFSTGNISVNAKSYTLYKSKLDKELSFKGLSTGKYLLVYTVTAEDGTIEMYDVSFTVKKK